jgi:lipase ATG15
MLGSLPSTLQLLLGLVVSNQDAQTPLPATSSIRFSLRHEHAIMNSSRIILRDIPQSTDLVASNTYDIGVAPMTIHRPSSSSAFQQARFGPRNGEALQDLWWENEEVDGPNVTSRMTLLTLAKMSNNAYYDNGTTGDKGWYDLGKDWTVVGFIL